MADSDRASRNALLIAVFAVWLAGNALRLTLLAVPPVIALIRDDFSLSATEVGLLGALPQVLFAIAALAGSLLVARLGIRSALVGGLLLIALGSALRGSSPNFGALLATTIVMSIGIAILHPIMPTAVRRWMPGHIGLGTAIYTNGLLVGEILPMLLTIPLVLPLVDDSWRLSFVFWSIPIAVIAAVVAVAAPRPVVVADAPPVRHKWMPDWRDPLVWRLGALFCGITGIYFSTNIFLPIYLTSVGRPDLITGALLALNLGQLPASFLMLAIAGRVERRAWVFVASGIVIVVGLAGLVLDVGAATIWWAALLGFAEAAVFIAALALPPLLCRPDDVAPASAGMFTLSYGGSVIVTIVCGVAWDVSGIPAFAFAPLVACAVAMAAISIAMKAKGALL